MNAGNGDLILCTVYKSHRVADTYLYTDRTKGVDDIPVELTEHFGELVEVLTFRLTAERSLGYADASEVMSSIRDRGFYLQLPPPVVNPEAGDGPR